MFKTFIPVVVLMGLIGLHMLEINIYVDIDFIKISISLKIMLNSFIGANVAN